jgi:uracil-DNA glycosylase
MPKAISTAKSRVQKAADLARFSSETTLRKPRSNESLTERKLEDLAKRIRICVKCPLHESRTLAVPGEGKVTAQFMVIGEAPGKQEDLAGRPFIGNAGRYLDHVLEGTELERKDFFITNIVKCRPPSNRTPKRGEIETCTSLYLFEQIQLINPKLILLLGNTAVKTMLGLKSVEEVRGRIVSHAGRKYLATYHPAVRFYREDLAQKIKEDFALLKSELVHIAVA